MTGDEKNYKVCPLQAEQGARGREGRARKTAWSAVWIGMLRICKLPAGYEDTWGGECGAVVGRDTSLPVGTSLPALGTGLYVYTFESRCTLVGVVGFRRLQGAREVPIQRKPAKRRSKGCLCLVESPLPGPAGLA